ncbi:hypothetical protein MMC07_003243 [Pseudocyphellaria aurata]|nr:hypothetical protein [Pseudocyphellaria aurata]
MLLGVLQVEGRTIDTGAKSTFICSCGAGEGDEDEERPKVYLTAAYELKLSNVQGNTKAARDIEVDYTALARGACRSAVKKIKRLEHGRKAGCVEEGRRDGGIGGSSGSSRCRDWYEICRGSMKCTVNGTIISSHPILVNFFIKQSHACAAEVRVETI